jgi:hypothetical protein
VAFRYDYRRRKGASEIRKALPAAIPFVRTVQQKCGATGCNSLVEVIAVRSPETTPELFQSETARWDKSKILCKEHDPLLQGADTEASLELP